MLDECGIQPQLQTQVANRANGMIQRKRANKQSLGTESTKSNRLLVYRLARFLTCCRKVWLRIIEPVLPSDFEQLLKQCLRLQGVPEVRESFEQAA